MLSRKTIMGTLTAGAAAAFIGLALNPVSAFAAPTVDDGVYVINNAGLNKPMTHSGLAKDTTRILPEVTDGDITTKFLVTYQANQDAYTIRSVASMGFLADNKNSSENDAMGNTYIDGAADSYWYITPDNLGNYTISNKRTGDTVFANYSDVSVNGTYSVKAMSNTYDDRSKWKMTRLGTYEQPVPNGTYVIAWGDNGAITEVLDITNGSIENNAKLQLYPYNRTDAQKFIITFNPADLTYEIKNLNSGRAVDVAGGTFTRGTNIQQYYANREVSQKWYIVPSGNGYSFLTTKGNPMLATLDSHGILGSHQMTIGAAADSVYADTAFTFTLKNPADIKWCPVDDFPAGYAVRITSKLNPVSYRNSKSDILHKEVMCMDIKDGSSLDKANVQLYFNNNTFAQYFIITKLENGYYTIMNAKSQKLLDVARGSFSSGANVWQYTGNGTSAQQWELKLNADGSYTFISRLSGCALDLSSNANKPKQNIQVWHENGTTAQKWWIQ